MLNKRYESELKNKVIQLHLDKKSLIEEHHLEQDTLTYWLQQYRKECKDNSIKQEELESYKENKVISFYQSLTTPIRKAGNS